MYQEKIVSEQRIPNEQIMITLIVYLKWKFVADYKHLDVVYFINLDKFQQVSIKFESE